MTSLLPKVTIMIPTYNQEAYIQKSILSALNQDYKNLEVIVGDDCSSDGTSEIIEEINDPRLKYIRNKVNLGRTENYRNILFKHAQGELIVNLDGDDFYTDRSFISDAVKIFTKHENTVIVAAMATTHNGCNYTSSKLPDAEVLTGIEILKNLPDPHFSFMHLASLYVRDKALALDFYHLSVLSSDWESLYRLSLRGEVRYLHKNVGVWVKHQNNQSDSLRLQEHLDNLVIWQSIFDDARKIGMSTLAAWAKKKQCVSFYIGQSFRKLALYRDFADARKFFLSILYRYPFPTILMLLNIPLIASILFRLTKKRI